MYEDPLSDSLILADLSNYGMYKFTKTSQVHVVQGVQDPGPSNGESLNPLAVLGYPPTGKTRGVSKTIVTKLY